MQLKFAAKCPSIKKKLFSFFLNIINRKAAFFGDKYNKYTFSVQIKIENGKNMNIVMDQVINVCHRMRTYFYIGKWKSC